MHTSPAPLVHDDIGEHLWQLLKASQQGYAIFDAADVLRFANARFRMSFGLDEHEFPSWADLMRMGHLRSRGTNVVAPNFEAWLNSARSRRGKLPFRTIEGDLIDGGWILMTETTLPNGWMLCVMTDVSRWQSGERELRLERDVALRAAMSDELTGMNNRRFLMDHLHALLGADKIAELAIVVIDLDRFKRINDHYGHDVGDRVLRDFAGRVQSHLRRDDIAGRLGGEEFLIVMPTSSAEVVDGVMTRIMAALRASELAGLKPPLRYTCSAGIAIAEPGESAASLLKRADVALYECKQAGRDRYRFSQSGESAALGG